MVKTGGDWIYKYNDACDELANARAQYKRAENLMAEANHRLNTANAKVSDLFKERMSEEAR